MWSVKLFADSALLWGDFEGRNGAAVCGLVLWCLLKVTLMRV